MTKLPPPWALSHMKWGPPLLKTHSSSFAFGRCTAKKAPLAPPFSKSTTRLSLTLDSGRPGIAVHAWPSRTRPCMWGEDQDER